MLFSTDKQTLNDLNIFGRHGAESIFYLFNRCVTSGGAALLEELFRHPLSDDKAINRRAGIIRHFKDAAAGFPFSPGDFGIIDAYLANRDERSRLSMTHHSLAGKLGHMLAPEAAVQQVIKGVHALADVLKTCRRFLQSLPPVPDYDTEKESMQLLLSEPALAPILNCKQKLSFEAVAGFDVLLRFRYHDTIKKILKYIYQLDVYIAVARVAREREFVLPKALPRQPLTVSIEGIYHPQVNKAVRNNISIGSGSNLIFLTGANMAGKSTFMKSFSIAMYLAHMGFPVAAERMTFSVSDGIYTTINLPDNLGIGASHFYAEVLRVKKMAQELAAGKNLFIVFDELFRGTNVKDACEATIAIVEGFARHRNSVFVVSTHIIEAGAILKRTCDNVKFIYLPTKMNGAIPVYTYTIEEGITNDRHGMVIVNNEGILNILEEGIQQMKLS
ncbi:MutS-related protein [Filimonas effusa]|uniref:DNA mismatch repair protein n=1 Tax=Filimonas effusa TaxID=2508721 RepID=A0A4Q1DA39_9BACT|nr:DNA mismatch repair protein [Filimonas effusa]RXK85413.1 DNA mismatch repair protein [Filimonas effusa]